MKELEELIICQCENPEHMMVFRTIEGLDEVYVTIHLNSLAWYKRAWHALKFLFGYRCRLGDFDEIIIKPEDLPKFQKVVNYLKKSQKKNESNS